MRETITYCSVRTSRDPGSTQHKGMRAYQRPVNRKGKKRGGGVDAAGATATAPASAAVVVSAQKIDLDMPMTDEQKIVIQEEQELYAKYVAEQTENMKVLEAKPNVFDTGPDYMMRVFFGNSSAFLVHELRMISEALAAQYSGQDAIDARPKDEAAGPPVSRCSVSNEELDRAQKKIRRVIDNIAISRNHARLLIISMLGQLHKVYAHIQKHCDQIRFEVFTRWLRPALEDLIFKKTSAEHPHGRFPSIHRFVYEAQVAYVQCPDEYGKMNMQLSAAAAAPMTH